MGEITCKNEGIGCSHGNLIWPICFNSAFVPPQSCFFFTNSVEATEVKSSLH